MQNCAGYYKTNLSGELAYKSFVPSSLFSVADIDLSKDVNNLLITAHTKLAILENISTRIPSISLFVSMYVRKEALMSSQIEGTQATLEDILDPGIEENANRNVQDVVNYTRAIEFAVKRLEELPLCNRLLKETHAVLMEGVRGQEKSPGEFRRSQNWLGGQGSSLKNARYIPPNQEDMLAAMSDLEKFMNEEDNLDVLLRIALLHYQFETIHPFLDGNGRIGRLLIILFLIEKKIISTPALYISYFLKRNRVEYYDRLTEVREKGNYEQWIHFFLQAVITSAQDAVECIDKLSELHAKNLEKINSLGRASKNALLIFAYLESQPIIDIHKTAAALKISYNTASAAVKRLVDLGILEQTTNANRNRCFAYEAYLDILREGT